MSNPNGKSWVFTINNYTEEDIKAVKAIPAKKIIAGFEVGEKGTPHIQGAVVFGKAVRRKKLCKVLGGRAWCEKMYGAWSDQDYCFKEGDLLRMEDNSDGQGTRTDLDEFAEAIENGASDEVLIRDHRAVLAKYPRFETRLKKFWKKRRCREYRKLAIRTVVGIGGIGKSKRALYDGAGKRLADTYIVPSTDNLKWWPDYEGEKKIIINEMNGSRCKYDRWKDIVDGHQLYLEEKGGGMYAEYTDITMCSNKHPNEWWPGIPGATLEHAEFRRRLGRLEIHQPDGSVVTEEWDRDGKRVL